MNRLIKVLIHTIGEKKKYKFQTIEISTNREYTIECLPNYIVYV